MLDEGMTEPQMIMLTIEAAAADAEVDVDTYWAILRECDRERVGPCPRSIERDDHERVMLSLSIPPPL